MTTESKNEKSDLTIHLYRNESLAIKLKDMYETSMGDFASNLFSPAYLTKHKVPPASIVEVKNMTETEKTIGGEYTFNLAVKGSWKTKGISTEWREKITPINIKLHKQSGRCSLAIKRFKDRRPYQFDGYWWSVSAMDYTCPSEVCFTLTNPCKTHGEWESMHKPAPKVNEMQGLLNHHRKQPDIVYIAGAITGDVESNRHRFFAAKHSIMASSTNTTVLNPAELPEGLTQTQYMSICLPMVMMSTSIFMLEGWEKSKGAITEHALALKLGIEITYQGEHDGKL